MTILKQYFYKMLPFSGLTPPKKTPWAGAHIASIKQHLGAHRLFGSRIGESYEISLDQDFPSQVILINGRKISLKAVLQEHAQWALGQGVFSCLLKWLHASQLLSVQVHPENGHRLLTEGMCGKPEAWYVAEITQYTQQEPVLYLGWKQGVTLHDVEDSIAHNLQDLLFQYHPKKGDYIFLPPGCVHALGPDVFVIEPQQIEPDHSGQTWRLFDWNRTYDDTGNFSSEGTNRPLHIPQSLAAIDWNLPREQDFVREFIFSETRPGVSYQHRVRETWVNPFVLIPIASGVYETQNRAVYITVLKKSVELCVGTQKSVVYAGESVLVCAGAQELVLTVHEGCEGVILRI